MSDPFGQAIQEFQLENCAPDIIVNSNYTENECIPVSYLFRSEQEMPELEKVALHACKGKILDIGAAAGCHSLVLQKQGYDVTALEKSALATQVMQQRGITNAVNADIFEYTGNSFDTLLLLMNGTGIAGTVSGLEKLLNKLKSLLNAGGQILIDSSDIKYLFEEADGSYWVDLANNNYYGEMEYEVRFRKWRDSFKWLFIDAEKLTKAANKSGLTCHILYEGAHFDYLAQLKPCK